MTHESEPEANTRFDRLQQLLKGVQSLQRPKFETTVFSIGGRRYYENATSDVLAFFLDPKREHGLGRVVLDALLAAAAAPGCEPEEFEPVAAPCREYRTAGGKFIDLLVDGQTSVLVIENKVRHTPVNPFSEYEAEIKRCFPNKLPIRLLLTYRDDPIEGWTTVRYQKFCQLLRDRIGHVFLDAPYGKWAVLFRELVLTLEEEMANVINQSELDFFAANHGAMEDAYELYWRYLNHLGVLASSSVARALQLGDADAKGLRYCVHDWKEAGRAVRVLFDNRWGKESNVTLLALRPGGFRCSIYAHGFESGDRDRVQSYLQGPGAVGDSGTVEYWVEGGPVFVAGTRTGCVDRLDAALSFLGECALRLDCLYTEFPRTR